MLDDSEVSLDSGVLGRLAHHFSGSVLEEKQVRIAEGVALRACATPLGAGPAGHRVSLSFEIHWLHASRASVALTTVGYGDSDIAAAVSGTCEWARSFAAVLQQGLSGAVDGGIDVTVAGMAYRCFVDGLDRSVDFNGAEPSEPSACRKRLGGTPFLLPGILEEVDILSSHRPTVVSLFVGDGLDERMVEFKVDGWELKGTGALRQVPKEDEGGVVFLREVAVLVPVDGRRALTKGLVASTLDSTEAAKDKHARWSVLWPGWSVARFAKRSVMSVNDMKGLEEALGTLPEDYRQFLLTVGIGGGGPGYGLLSPFSCGQRRLAQGRFTWVHSGSAESGPAGVLALAHAGCSIMWLLVLEGECRGEVWVDAQGSDGTARRVAGSFTEWFESWLVDLCMDVPFAVDWDSRCCAPSNVLGTMLSKRVERGLTLEDAKAELKQIGPSSVAVASGGNYAFDNGDMLGPCEGCARLFFGLGVSAEVFAAGVDPFQDTDAPKIKRPWWRFWSS